MQDVSRQVVDRGVPGTDEVIYGDLLADFFKKWDAQVLTSSTANFEGLLEADGINAITYTDASPTLPELYPKLADAIGQIHTNVFGPATAVLMHSRRWAWAPRTAFPSRRPRNPLADPRSGAPLDRA